MSGAWVCLVRRAAVPKQGLSAWSTRFHGSAVTRCPIAKNRLFEMPTVLRIVGLIIALLLAGLARAEVNVHRTRFIGVHGCDVRYERYQPAAPRTNAVILLAHGFKRDLSTMRGWASHWAAAGIPVVIPSLCRSSWLQGRHAQNADDLIALRAHLGIRKTIYAGFSAGGLAAYLAALEDQTTIAYLGLDPVDSGKLAAKASKRLQVQGLFLFAGASICNGRNNFLPLAEKLALSEVLQLGHATHCEFEWPFDSKCNWVCSRSDNHSPAEVQREIRQLIDDWLAREMGYE